MGMHACEVVAHSARAGLLGAVVTLAAPHQRSPWHGQARRCAACARDMRHMLMHTPPPLCSSPWLHFTARCTPTGMRCKRATLRCRSRRSAAGHGATYHAHISMHYPASHACPASPARSDFQVPDWLSALRLPHAASASSLHLAGVGVSADHQCIVWCGQVVAHAASALRELASGVGVERSAAGAAFRTAVLQRWFQADAGGAPHARDAAWLRNAAAVWAVINVPRLPALCAAAVAAAAHQARAGGACMHSFASDAARGAGGEPAAERGCVGAVGPHACVVAAPAATLCPAHRCAPAPMLRRGCLLTHRRRSMRRAAGRVQRRCTVCATCGGADDADAAARGGRHRGDAAGGVCAPGCVPARSAASRCVVDACCFRPHRASHHTSGIRRCAQGLANQARP